LKSNFGGRKKISKYDERYIQGEWSTCVSLRNSKCQGRLVAMQVALETRLYKKEKNKHCQKNLNRVGRGANTRERVKEFKLT